MTLRLLVPLPKPLVITQTYAQHVARAKREGWCSKPGVNCKAYYFGGVDYSCPIGTPVIAAADGKVTVARADGSGYGLHVRIEHRVDGDSATYLTVYGHLSEEEVAVGEDVLAGQLIGWSGNTGNSSGPHLHFELRKGNVPQDPTPHFVAVEPPAPPEEPGDPDGVHVAKVLSTYGLALRSEPLVASATLLTWMPKGTRLSVMDETFERDGIVWRRAVCWVAESSGDSVLLEVAK